jgi:lipoprotein-anchoring transpeptidase ErfK/SrfK
VEPIEYRWQARRVIGGFLMALVLAPRARTQSLERADAINGPHRQVLVSIPDRKLAVLANGEVIATFPVSVGAAISPSPTGEFRIVTRLANPTYYHPGVVIPPGDHNPIGPRWIGLNLKGYGIHGTDQPWSIGKARSHGCIRMRNRDIEQFFSLVSVGDTVEIRSERSPRMAQIFGGRAEAARVVVARAQPTSTDAAGGSQ